MGKNKKDRADKAGKADGDEMGHERQQHRGMRPPRDEDLIDCPVDLTQLVKWDWYTALDEKLKSVASSCPTPPAWHAAWLHSTRGRTGIDCNPELEAEPEERLAVWKAIRDSGHLPEDAGFFLVAGQIYFLTKLHVAEALWEIEQRTDALYAEHGFEDWRSHTRRDSEDFLEFNERCPEDWDRLYFGSLVQHGEHEIAKLYKTDREGFERRMQAGSDFFYLPVPDDVDDDDDEDDEVPEWMAHLQRDVAESECIVLLESKQARLCLGFTWCEHQATVCLSLVPAQLVGGDRDGEVVYHNFVLDVERLRAVFDEVHGCSWDPFDHASTPLVSHVRVAGTYHGHPLVLRVLSVPDECEEPEHMRDS